jgi:hypothetical protein
MDQVNEWLQLVGLDQYRDAFAAAGYDEIGLLDDLHPTEFDALVAAVGLLPGHALKLKRRLLTHPPCTNSDIPPLSISSGAITTMATSIGKMTHASRVVSTNSPFYGIQRGSLGTPVSPSGLRPIGTPREDVYGAHAVEISVGGTIFTASRATWTRFTGTLLAAIVDSKWSSQVCARGVV